MFRPYPLRSWRALLLVGWLAWIGIAVHAEIECPETTPRWFDQTACGQRLAAKRWNISGWTEMAFTVSTADNNQLPLGFNYLANEFTLQQNWLRLERTADQEGDALDWGFRNDWILPGTDYRFTLPRGLFNDQLTADGGQPNRYGIDAVQFYGEVWAPHLAEGIDVKVGRFLLPYGFETTEAITTPFVSRAYSFLYNPFTQFGVLSTTKLNDQWSVYFGLTAGNDVVIDPANEPTLDLGCRWTSPKACHSVNVFGIFGEGQFNAAENFNNPNLIDIVYTHAITEEWTSVCDLHCGWQRDVPGLGNVSWQGFAKYFSYQVTPEFALNLRGEYFNDQDGNRTGFRGVYRNLTTGFACKPRTNLILRSEVRVDYNNDSRPFDGQDSLVTGAADVIVRW